MSNLKIGIIGLGWVAGAHIEAFKQIAGVEVAAVCSRRELDESVLEAKYGIALKLYNRYEEMIADPTLDIIDICTPHPLHPEQAILVAQAGKHIFFEKPIAFSCADACRIREVVREAGVKVCVGLELRYNSQAMAINSLVERGLLGEVYYAEVDYYHGVGPWYGQFPWNIKKDMGGSSLLTAGIHAVDMLMWFMDSEVEEVTSYSNKSKSELFEPYEYDTTSVTLLKFQNGKIGKITSIVDCLQPYYFHIHLVGSKGSILDDQFYSSDIEGTSKDRWGRLGVPKIDSGDVDDHPYLPQFTEFVRSIKEDSIMPLTDFETAFQSHTIVYVADMSAESGKPVKIDDVKNSS